MNEKELAVQMWEEIKEQIKEGKLNNGLEIYVFKKSFAEKHNLHWGDAHCYLCAKFKYCCSVCPIGSKKKIMKNISQTE